MTFRRLATVTAAAALFALPALAQPRDIVIFVADGLRYDSVTPDVAPTMYGIKKEGVDFTNSHAMYPTVTTANASAIASGHYLGDTGDYGNTLLFDTPIPCKQGVVLTFLEDDCVLRDVKAHFGDGYMGQTTLTMAAREAGYLTAVVGKRGPAAIQSLPSLDAKDAKVSDQLGVLIDDGTNRPTNADGTPTMSTMLSGGLNGEFLTATGEAQPALTATPNLTQQSWLTGGTTQALIPDLKDTGQPFVLVFWSRDPDATQHTATDSEGRLVPGINSATARTAIAHADFDLHAIMNALKAAGLDDNTDIFVTADHGFSTIMHGIPTTDGAATPPSLVQGFLAFDIADWLGGLTVYDPDRANAPMDRDNGEHPVAGDAFIGHDPTQPDAVVAANGGTDFIYARGADPTKTAITIFSKLRGAPYVGALFVNDALLKGHEKEFAGALPMSAINLIGFSTVPQPSIVVGFRSFVAKGCTLGALLCTVEIADTPLHTGQGMHGSFSRADTRNFMAAIGPDFKKGYADPTPVSNADIAPTLAHLIGANLAGPGFLKGRIAQEALTGARAVPFQRKSLASDPASGGQRTVLQFEDVGGTRYFDAAGIPGRTVGLTAK